MRLHFIFSVKLLHDFDDDSSHLLSNMCPLAIVHQSQWWRISLFCVCVPHLGIWLETLSLLPTAIILCVRATNDNNRPDNQYYEQKWLCVSRLLANKAQAQATTIHSNWHDKKRTERVNAKLKTTNSIEQWLGVIFFWLSKWKSYQWEWDTFCYCGAAAAAAVVFTNSKLKCK